MSSISREKDANVSGGCLHDGCLQKKKEQAVGVAANTGSCCHLQWACSTAVLLLALPAAVAAAAALPLCAL